MILETRDDTGQIVQSAKIVKADFAAGTKGELRIIAAQGGKGLSVDWIDLTKRR